MKMKILHIYIFSLVFELILVVLKLVSLLNINWIAVFFPIFLLALLVIVMFYRRLYIEDRMQNWGDWDISNPMSEAIAKIVKQKGE